MTSPATSALPSIAEHEASGEIAELYADIKASLAIPAVNLVWRHLATIDGALQWVWGSVRPLYVDGVLDAEADGLRDIPGLLALPRLHPAALRTLGIRSDDESVLRAVLANYDQSNAINLLAFMALLARLRGANGNERTPGPAKRAPTADVPMKLPSLLSPQEMSADTRELGRVLLAIGTDTMPAWFSDSVGLPRHLAHWPGFLALSVSVLAPWHDAIANSIHAVHQRAAVRGRALAPLLAQLPVTTVNTRPIVAALEPFTQPFAIASLIPKVRMLRMALGSPPQAGRAL